MTHISWPKPSIFPWCSVVYALINIGITYGLASMIGHPQQPDWIYGLTWTSPSWAFNVFFLWAEYDDYRREKLNYEGWKREMRYMSGADLPKNWKHRIDELRKRKG